MNRCLATVAFPVLACMLVASCRSRPSNPGPSAPHPTFQADIEPVLARTCASADGCHGDHATHSVALDLRPGHSYAALVSAPAKTRAGAVRVVPGAPESSFLIDKLDGSLAFGEGKPMPLDPDTGAPPASNPVPTGFVDGVLKPWIARGSPRD